MNRDSAPPWYLLTGFLLGIGLGLFYTWAISPVAYVDVPPDTLQADYKAQYRAMIALAYAADGNLTRAQARLTLLGDADPLGALTEQAQQALAAGRPEAEASALGKLAAALGGAPQAPTRVALRPSNTPQPSFIPSPTATATPAMSATATLAPSKTPSPRATFTPKATFTPLPTRPPTATPGAPFVLNERALICEPTWTHPLVRVQVSDAAGQPVPGVNVTIRWENQEEVFFTGLKPNLGPGVADFEMTPGVSYTLVVGQGGQLITDLQATECQAEDGGRFWGSWLLTFVQP